MPSTHSRLADVLLARGMHDQAIAEYRKALELAGGHPNARAMLAHAYGVSGRAKEAKALLLELIASAKHEYVAPLDLARVYLGLGERDRALDWVERAYAHPASAAWPFHLIDPMFDGLRSEPRFIAVLQEIGPAIAGYRIRPPQLPKDTPLSREKDRTIGLGEATRVEIPGDFGVELGCNAWTSAAREVVQQVHPLS